MTLFQNKYRIESSRLKGWDYRNPGHYFVTICTRGRGHFFGRVAGGDVRLLAVGEIAAQCWTEIPQHHAGVALDEWVVMPNHVHGIIVLTAPVVVETLHCNVSTETGKMSAISPKTGSLAVVMRSYKSAVSRLAHLAGHEFGWQERYWDHIVRDNGEFLRIRNYIFQNPVKWETDRENEPGLWM
jgi:REP element-mobilizing transposase RayT